MSGTRLELQSAAGLYIVLVCVCVCCSLYSRLAAGETRFPHSIGQVFFFLSFLSIRCVSVMPLCFGVLLLCWGGANNNGMKGTGNNRLGHRYILCKLQRQEKKNKRNRTAERKKQSGQKENTYICLCFSSVHGRHLERL